MNDDTRRGTRELWARLRFSIIGPLLAAPPSQGELHDQLASLAAKSYRHPTTGESVKFSLSTVERWLYLARNNPDDPFGALARKVHRQAGTHPSVSAAVEQALRAQYSRHPSWSYRLHYDNLVAQAEQDELGQVASYNTVSRFMKSAGLIKQRRRRRRKEARDEQGQEDHEASDTFEQRERRSYQAPYVHSLWHADFHIGRRKVLLPTGQWVRPVLFAALDDCSRLCCHLQWYLTESTETFVHGLSQAILKRGLPRALLTDNGSAMTAAESVEGLERLGIVHHTTLPHTPEPNAKAENFWARVEGRLLAMYEGYRELTLDVLNHGTQAWAEVEYHDQKHQQLAATPLEVVQQTRSVGRAAPDSDRLRQCFRKQETRRPRPSDATVSVQGVRFELPWRYRSLSRVTLRFARWDLSSVDLIDPKLDTRLAILHPVDPLRNADGRRRLVEPADSSEQQQPESEGIAPHLRRLMEQYAASGLPPAYLPLRRETTEPPSGQEPPAQGQDNPHEKN